MTSDNKLTSLTQAQQRIHAAAVKLFAERGATQVNVTDLAQAAGVARGTIYNNLVNPESLFEEVAAELAQEMNLRVTAGFGQTLDPAARLTQGIRHYIRRAHEEPHWGRFFCRFAFNNATLQKVWEGQPVIDLMEGQRSGRFVFRPEQVGSVINMLAGTVLGGMFLVLEGVKTWRDASSDGAELMLVALGVPRAEARTLAAADQPGDRRN